MARRGKVIIHKDLCKGCLLCIKACPLKVLETDIHINVLGCYPTKPAHTEKCIACGNCFEVCPDACIEIYELEGSEV